MMSSGDLRYSILAGALSHIFYGFLMTDPVEFDETEDKDYIQAVVTGASYKEYLTAREYFRVITSRYFASVFDLIKTESTVRDRRVASEAVQASVKGDAGWSVFILVQGLFVARQGRATLTEQQIRGLVAQLDEKSLTIDDALAVMLASRLDSTKSSLGNC
jgi:hypothetical protein